MENQSSNSAEVNKKYDSDPKKIYVVVELYITRP